MKLNKIFNKIFNKTFPGKRNDLTLIDPMNYKPQIFIGEVLQCLVDKYVMTYENIWGEGMVRPHLVKSSHCKILVPLKGVPILRHFFRKKIFLVVAAT